MQVLHNFIELSIFAIHIVGNFPHTFTTMVFNTVEPTQAVEREKKINMLQEGLISIPESVLGIFVLVLSFQSCSFLTSRP